MLPKIPKSASGSGLSRSVTLALAAGVVAIASGFIEILGYDLFYVEDPSEMLQWGAAAIIAAFGLRRVGPSE